MSLNRYIFVLGASLAILNFLLVFAGYSGVKGYVVINALFLFTFNLLFPIKSARSAAVTNTIMAVAFIGFLSVVAVTTSEAILAI